MKRHLNSSATILLLAALFCAPMALYLSSGQALAQKGKTAASSKKSEEEKPKLKSKDFFLRKVDPGKYEEMARQKRAEAITLLKGILDSGNIDNDQLPEMYMRLAELYWETAKDKYLSEMDDYLERYGEWVDEPDDTKGPEPKEDHTESRTYNRQAIDLYRTILQKHRRYPRMDEVYFNLAFNLMDLGEKEQGLDYYQTMVKNFPQSDFVPDAYLAIGEYYFDNNNAFKALGNYRKAATYKQTKVYIFAMYKLGWCYYNVGEYGKAINSMKTVIAESEEAGDKVGQLSLKDEALSDLVLFFAETKDLEAAKAYFGKYGEKRHYAAMLHKLASIYLEQGKNDEAIKTYRHLVAEDPMAPGAPGYQKEIIGAYFKSGRKQETLREIDRLAAEYGKDSKWAVANANNQKAIDEANKMIELNLRNVAVDYHKEARKTRSKSTYTLAQNSYRKYLNMFPKNKYSYDIRFNYAEVLYELKQYAAAADEYEKVLTIDPKGKHYQVAASSLIFAIDKVLKTEGKSGSSTKAGGSGGQGGISQTPLTKWEQRKVKACDGFADALPDHKDSSAYLYEGARLLYDKNHFKEAIPRFMKIVDRYGKQEIAEVSANLVLDSYNQLQDWTKLEETGRAFNKNEELNARFRKEARDIYEQAAFKKIEPLEKSNKFGDAAASYLKFYEEFGNSGLSDTALFNAAVYFFKAGDVHKSIEMRETLLAKFPRSKFMNSNLDALGKVYESIADYATAAKYYEQLAESDRNRSYKGTADAMYNAGLFRYSLGQWEKAIENYQAYIANFPSREDSHLLRLEIGRIFEENGRLDDAAKVYKTYFESSSIASRDPDAQFDARLRYGKILRKQGMRDKADRHFRQSSELYDKMVAAGTQFKTALRFIAEMRFYMVEPLYDRYAAMRIELPKRGSRKKVSALDEKVKVMGEVSQAYNEVLQLKQAEWGIAALVQIGEAYQNLAQTILDAPIPPLLKTPDQKRMYRASLEDRAFPVRDSAADVLEQALARAYELGIYNDYTALAWKRLADLRPKEYPPLVELFGTPDRLSDTFFAAEFKR